MGFKALWWTVLLLLAAGPHVALAFAPPPPALQRQAPLAGTAGSPGAGCHVRGAPAASPPSLPRKHRAIEAAVEDSAGGGSGGDRARRTALDQLLAGEGALVVSTARFPLIGLPRWSPKLHAGVVLSRREGTGDEVSFLLFDFVPAAPTEVRTALALARGGSVPGIVREKVLSITPAVVEPRGPCRRSVAEIRQFCEGYDARLSLLNNNCYSFVDALLRFVLLPVDD